MSEELRAALEPCPFCGGEAERFTIEEEGDNFGGDVICCKKCGASSHVEFGRKENLVDCWNRRASTDAAAVGIKYDDTAQDAVMRLLETGKATVNADGYLVAHPPVADAAVAGEEVAANEGRRRLFMRALAGLNLNENPVTVLGYAMAMGDQEDCYLADYIEDAPKYIDHLSDLGYRITRTDGASTDGERQS